MIFPRGQPKNIELDHPTSLFLYNITYTTLTMSEGIDRVQCAGLVLTFLIALVQLVALKGSL